MVGEKVIRFTPARTYLTATAVALGLAVFSAWCATRWWPAVIPAGLFLVSALLVAWLGFKPAIEISEQGMKAGRRRMDWKDVRRVDQTGWVSPLVADLTLADNTRVRLVYPGETENSNRLLRLIQQRSTEALINGVPHRQIFGEPMRELPATVLGPGPRYRLLNEEDEAEVERLYQKLRAAGRLDPEK